MCNRDLGGRGKGREQLSVLACMKLSDSKRNRTKIKKRKNCSNSKNRLLKTCSYIYVLVDSASLGFQRAVCNEA